MAASALEGVARALAQRVNARKNGRMPHLATIFMHQAPYIWEKDWYFLKEGYIYILKYFILWYAYSVHNAWGKGGTLLPFFTLLALSEVKGQKADDVFSWVDV